MANVHITLSKVGTKFASGGTMPVIDPVPDIKEYKANPTTSQQTAAVPSGDTYVWEVTAIGGDVWVRFAANPTASAGNDHLVLAGQTRNFGGVAGHKAAVINA